MKKPEAQHVLSNTARQWQVTRRARTSLAVWLVAVAALASGWGRRAEADAGAGTPDHPGARKARSDPNRLTSWLQMGGDLRLRAIRERARKLDKNDRGDDRFWQRYRARIWARITPTENIEFNLRIVTEPRYYCRRDLPNPLIREEALFDRLNVVWKNVLGLPLTATVGRQDLRLGSGWLVCEGTPMDGSRTAFFDALRFTYGLEEWNTTADLVWIDNHANSSKWIRPFNDRDVDLAEQDERGVILYVTNRSLKETRIDGYFIYKQDHNPSTRNNGSEGDIYTLGAMAEGDLGGGWKYRVEVAGQFGHKNGKDLCGLGSNNRLSYHFNDPMDNRLHLGYEYLSGDDDAGRHFDKLWGRESQWSDLYNGAIDSLDGRDFDSSNLHRPNLTWEFRPVASVRVITDYSLLFCDQNTSAGGTGGLSRSGCFRGQLLKVQVKHRLNERVHQRFTAEVFLPGDFYTSARNDVAMFLRYGIMFTW